MFCARCAGLSRRTSALYERAFHACAARLQLRGIKPHAFARTGLPVKSLDEPLEQSLFGVVGAEVETAAPNDAVLVGYSRDVASRTKLLSPALSSPGHTGAHHAASTAVAELGGLPRSGEGQACAIAQGYGGHQFGHWAGQLGDGRAASIGSVAWRGSRPSTKAK